MGLYASHFFGFVALVMFGIVAAQDDTQQYPRNMITPKATDDAPGASVVAGRWTVPCSSQYLEPTPQGEMPQQHPGCTPQTCQRVVVDHFIPRGDLEALLAIAKKGFAFSSKSAEFGGPTISKFS